MRGWADAAGCGHADRRSDLGGRGVCDPIASPSSDLDATRYPRDHADTAAQPPANRDAFAHLDAVAHARG